MLKYKGDFYGLKESWCNTNNVGRHACNPCGNDYENC